jgi:hypothetical protein
LAKGDFPAEMDISLPFSLVNNNLTSNELEVLPAYWWLYNMYALARNTQKYKGRDKRLTKIQNIEFDTFAPDSMEEAISARKLLEVWTAKAYYRQMGDDSSAIEMKQLRKKGHQLLHGDRSVVDALDIYGEGMEKSQRPVRILKAYNAYHAYGDMLIHYAMSNVIEYVERQDTDLESLSRLLESRRQRDWINLGGQLMMVSDLDRLRADIRDGVLDSWKAIHRRYNEIWKRYPIDKLRHAYLSLCFVLGAEKMTPELWLQALAHEERIQRRIAEQVYLSRKKDNDNPFRACTCRNEEEYIAVFGVVEDNSFVRQIKEDTQNALVNIDKLRNRIKY